MPSLLSGGIFCECYVNIFLVFGFLSIDSLCTVGTYADNGNGTL